MRFQHRDAEILLDIYNHDGVMAKRQLKEKYWRNKSDRVMEKRLSKLKNAGFITWPTTEQRRIHPVPEPICWLTWRGTLIVAGILGIKIDPPKSDNEYQLRSFHKKLRHAGIRWTREPRWSQLAHDLSIIDFKMMMDSSLNEIPNLQLNEWFPEGVFRADMDEIIFNTRDRSGKIKQVKKGICPDGYIEIIDKERLNTGKLHKARFLLEIDMATHDNPSFGIEKVIPGIEYIRSPEYKDRFGSNDGFWLVITKGKEKRLSNLIKQVEQHSMDDSSHFFLTSFEKIGDANLLSEPVWNQAGIDGSVALLE